MRVSKTFNLLALALVVFAALGTQAAQDKSVIRSEIIQRVMELLQPVSLVPEEGKAWHLSLQGDVAGKSGEIELAWDSTARVAIRSDIKGLSAVHAGFGETESWLYIPKHDKVFFARHAAPEGRSLLKECKAWGVLKQQLPGLGALLSFAPLPEDLVLEKDDQGVITLSDGDDLDLKIGGTSAADLTLKSSSEKMAGEIEVSSWSQVPASDLEKLLERPKAGTEQEVDIEHLRGMLATMTEFAAESVLARTVRKSVPDPMAGVPKESGIAVVRFSGTPEEMGKQHGTLLKEAIQYNMHRTLHGVGFVHTVETGKWFPDSLAEAWKTQEKYIPERYIQEIDAVADAAGIPREWGRSVNVFPELFHCSGLAMCGKATVDGKLYHGRILDYMTQIGLQNTAAVMVFEPEGRNPWVSIGYAGHTSTVSAMNAKGLAMGEMGGRGEGYLDGMPMSIMMREVVERFETTEDALAWMKSIPRTCEYFYVLSDSKTKSMAGIASYAKKLAEERNIEDFQVIRPGTAHELLPNAFEDTVLMSAGDRYDRLSKRVDQNFSKIDMQGAWDLMDKGVAMKSNLHTVLFAPETLDFWTAQAGPLGEPAYTQDIAKFNLGEILSRQSAVTTSDAGEVGSGEKELAKKSD